MAIHSEVHFNHIRHTLPLNLPTLEYIPQELEASSQSSTSRSAGRATGAEAEPVGALGVAGATGRFRFSD